MTAKVTVTTRDLYTLKVCRLSDGGVWLDLFATDGPFDGLCVVSAEGDSMNEAMKDLAERLDG